MQRLSPSGPNTDQIKYWNEVSAPKWIAYQRTIDEQIRPLGRAAMDRAAPQAGERILDVGCGCGDTTIELGRRVAPTGSATGIDVSTPMLERAAENARDAGVENVCFWNADAQTRDFPPQGFDLVYSRFGVMFFNDPVSAFTNLAHALRDGGRLGFVCWQVLERNPWMAVPTTAASREIAFPARSAADAPGPFAFADPERVRRILGEAGFLDVSVESLEATLTLGDADLDRTVEFLIQMGPTGSALREAGSAAAPRVARVVKDAVAPFHTERGLRMAAASWIVAARRA